MKKQAQTKAIITAAVTGAIHTPTMSPHCPDEEKYAVIDRLQDASDAHTALVVEWSVADELAAASSFVMGQSDEGVPVVVISGAEWQPSDAGSRSLIRARTADLFR